jgi:hypothetical protein
VCHSTAWPAHPCRIAAQPLTILPAALDHRHAEQSQRERAAGLSQLVSDSFYDKVERRRLRHSTPVRGSILSVR